VPPVLGECKEFCGSLRKQCFVVSVHESFSSAPGTLHAWEHGFTHAHSSNTKLASKDLNSSLGLGFKLGVKNRSFSPAAKLCTHFSGVCLPPMLVLAAPASTGKQLFSFLSRDSDCGSCGDKHD